uniref:(northern house mosquito) hypothetical protein n=1 Tax=Culex pipiens TaxID=7175 RepID=A0A8D8H8Q0_CULPI
MVIVLQFRSHQYAAFTCLTVGGAKVDKQLVSTLVSSTILWTEMLAMAKTEMMRSDISESNAANGIRYRARNRCRARQAREAGNDRHVHSSGVCPNTFVPTRLCPFYDYDLPNEPGGAVLRVTSG